MTTWCAPGSTLDIAFRAARPWSTYPRWRAVFDARPFTAARIAWPRRAEASDGTFSALRIADGLPVGRFDTLLQLPGANAVSDLPIGGRFDSREIAPVSLRDDVWIPGADLSEALQVRFAVGRVMARAHGDDASN